MFWIFLGLACFIAVYATCWMIINYRVFVQINEWIDVLERENDEEMDRVWGYVEGAHKRRKRVERYLKRERLRSAWLRQEVAGLHHRLALQEARNQSLAADLTSDLLKTEDRAKVREGLVKKIR